MHAPMTNTESLRRRPSLPTSTTEFALPSPTSSTNRSQLTVSADDLSPLLLRFRRPSLLAPHAGFQLAESRSRSPLATSFSLPFSRRYSTTINAEDADGENVKMLTDSPSSGGSGNATPFLPGPLPGSSMQNESDSSVRSSRPRSPSTPPPRTQPFPTIDIPTESIGRGHSRRLSHAVKMPRILTLISEARPDEDEVKSEAQFQRLVASCSESPSQSRVPRAASSRGRYPEEADQDEPLREDTPSDDGELDDTEPFAYTEPATSTKPVTPAQSVNGDDNGMLDSPGGVAMDVDLPPSVSASPSISSWRHTPPPTSSAVRSNKRKMEDRYDPYPTSAKRRAVSPSISHLRDLGCRSGIGTPRLTMPIPIPISTPASGASSPIVSASSYFGSSRASYSSTSALSSPTMRAQIGLASPVLRPMVRARRDEERELREIDGAGEAVNGLSLG